VESRLSKELLALLETCQNAAFITNSDGIIIGENSLFFRETKIKEASLIGINLFDIVIDSQEKVTKCLYSASRSTTPTVGKFTFRNKKKEKTLFPFKASLISPKTKILPALIVFQHISLQKFYDLNKSIIDLTKIKIENAKLTKIKNELQQTQKSDTIGQVAGGFAHEFNNILTIIMGNLDFATLNLIDKLDTNDTVFSFIEESMIESKKAAELVKKILMLKIKPNAGYKSINLNIILEELNKRLVSLVPDDISIEYIIENNLKNINIATEQLDQIIVNLINNAKEAMPTGGRLTIETSNVILHEEIVSSHSFLKAGSYVMLSVSDSGSGMDKITLKQIFDPFYSTKEINNCIGLGLSIVHRLVKQYGGYIIPFSKPGKGTTFKIYFPAIGQPEITKNATAKKQDLPGGTETILICDDNEDILKLTTYILTNSGYNTLSTNNGNDALKLTKDFNMKIDLLITDVVMPKMNGKLLSDELKSKITNLKTLFISGYSKNIIHHHGINQDKINFLEKPYTPKRLLEKIHNILHT